MAYEQSLEGIRLGVLRQGYTRRGFLARAAGGAAAGLLGGCVSGGAVRASARPNVLLIMTDQQTHAAMGCAGNGHVATPALDGLAARGLRFTQAYVTQPLCTPCRTSLQTGLYPHETGVTTNGRKVNGAFAMLGGQMAAAGYHCGYIGKWHVGASFEAGGYGEASDYEPDSEKTKAAVAFLERRHERPFFLTVSFMNPHNVCQLARGEALPDGPVGVPPESLEALPPLPANHAVPPGEPEVVRAVQRSIPRHYPTRDWDEGAWRRYLWGYYRLVEKVDAEIGRVLAALRAGGHEENTVVVFVSDHGEGVAMHGWNQKQVLYDQCVRVPLLVAGPGIPGGGTSDALVSTGLDIPRTIVDFGGAEPLGRGLSLRALAEGHAKGLPRDFVVAETVFAENVRLLGLRGRMVRTRRYKYCVYDRGVVREQLFDMQADPGETRNLAGLREHRSALREHRGLLQSWSRETNDTAFPPHRA